MSSINNIPGQSKNCTDENPINVMKKTAALVITTIEEGEIDELNLLLKDDRPELYDVVAENEGVDQAHDEEDQLDEYVQYDLIIEAQRKQRKERFMSDHPEAAAEMQLLDNQVAAAQKKYDDQMMIITQLEMNLAAVNDVLQLQRKTNANLVSQILKSRSSNPSFNEKFSEKKAVVDTSIVNIITKNCNLLDLKKKLITCKLQKYQALTEIADKSYQLENQFLKLMNSNIQELAHQNNMLEEIKEDFQGVAN